MEFKSKNSFQSLDKLIVSGKKYHFYNLTKAEKNGLKNIKKLPKSLKVLLENLLRFEDGVTVDKKQIEAVGEWLKTKRSKTEIAYRPARILLQDYTGIPAVADLAAMRDAVKSKNKDPKKINPLLTVDLVIDHSVMVDNYAKKDSFTKNVQREFDRNGERYSFLKWGQNAFDNFRVVPPGTGICHQVNLEYLSKVVWSSESKGETYAYPDTLVGTDSHTTMVNGLSVLGWGVGGIEAEAAMLGQPISMLIPEVVGFEIKGKLTEGTTASDLVLTIVQMLRKKGVVGKFVEFYGKGLKNLSLADRATIANMAPEYGATMGYFPVDNETLRFLRQTGRSSMHVRRTEKFLKEQNLFLDTSQQPTYSESIELDISTIEPAIAGPKRPQDRIQIKNAKQKFLSLLESSIKAGGYEITDTKKEVSFSYNDKQLKFRHGTLLIAAITSCTNTSNPSVMIGAGLLAKKAIEKGLRIPSYIKTSLAPGSKVVQSYLESAGLLTHLQTLGFNIVGFGCTTCIGNSGPLDEAFVKIAKENDLVTTSVLSGNRNFEGRVSPVTRANFLASPPLVLAYALSGRIDIDFETEPIGTSSEGNEVFLKDVWSSVDEINEVIDKVLKPEIFEKQYADVFTGTRQWEEIKTTNEKLFPWNEASTYIRLPSFFENITKEIPKIEQIEDAHVLVMAGDSVTTDHISPAGSIAANSPAASYLNTNDILPRDYNSYGSRRGNHEVMMRGTFANVRLRNLLAPGTEGGVTTHIPTKKQMPIFEASEKYKESNTSLIVLAGKDYGMGSSRDWAAKGPFLLGIEAVIFETVERIHRSNLIGMGILPLEYIPGENRESLVLTGYEQFTIQVTNDLQPRQRVTVVAKNSEKTIEFETVCRIDSSVEMDYYRNGGILQYVLRKFV